MKVIIAACVLVFALGGIAIYYGEAETVENGYGVTYEGKAALKLDETLCLNPMTAKIDICM